MATRANLKIATGTYIGNGSDFRPITGINFQPRIVFVIPETTGDPIFRMDVHGQNEISRFPANNDSSGIRNFISNGFVLSSSTLGNAGGVIYHYVAFAGSKEVLATGSFFGTAADNRDITDNDAFDFTIRDLFIKASAAFSLAWRNSLIMTGDSSFSLNTVAAANVIQSVGANTFQVGTSSIVNGAAVKSWFFGLSALPQNICKSGVYVGTGVDSEPLEIGFRPDFFFTKRTDTTAYGVVKTSTMSAVNARPFNGVAVGPGYINSLTSTGLTLGTNAQTNNSGTTYNYFAIKAGEYFIPFSRTFRS